MEANYKLILKTIKDIIKPDITYGGLEAKLSPESFYGAGMGIGTPIQPKPEIRKIRAVFSGSTGKYAGG